MFRALRPVRVLRGRSSQASIPSANIAVRERRSLATAARVSRSRLLSWNEAKHRPSSALAGSIFPQIPTAVPYGARFASSSSSSGGGSGKVSQWVMENFPEYASQLAPLLENLPDPSVVTTVILGWLGARINQVNILQRAQREIAELLGDANKIQVKLKKLYGSAFTVTNHRIQAQKINELHIETNSLFDRIEELEARINGYLAKPIVLKGLLLKKQWAKEFRLLKNIKYKLNSHLFITEMHVFCQLKKYDRAAHQMLKAFEQYINIVESSSTNFLTIQHLKKLSFLYRELFKLLNVMAKEIQSPTDTSNFNKKIDDLMEIISDFTNFDKLDPMRLCSKLEESGWYSDILTYLGYVIHDANTALKSAAKITDSKQHEGIKLLSKKLEVLSILFPILAITNHTDNYIAYNNLAHCYGMVGDFNNAEKNVRISIEKSASFALSHFNLALILQRQGKHEEANDHLGIAEGLLIEREEKGAASKPENELLVKIKKARKEKENYFPEKLILSEDEMELIKHFEKRAQGEEKPVPSVLNEKLKNSPR